MSPRGHAVIAAAVPPRRSFAATSIHSRPREALIPAAISWPRPLPASRPRRHAKYRRELQRQQLRTNIRIFGFVLLLFMWWYLVHVERGDWFVSVFIVGTSSNLHPRF